MAPFSLQMWDQSSKCVDEEWETLFQECGQGIRNQNRAPCLLSTLDGKDCINKGLSKEILAVAQLHIRISFLTPGHCFHLRFQQTGLGGPTADTQ